RTKTTMRTGTGSRRTSTSGPAGPPSRAPTPAQLSGRALRKRDPENRLLAGNALDPDPPAHQLDRELAEREPEPRVADRLRGRRTPDAPELLEHVLDVRFRDAGAAIDHAQHDVRRARVLRLDAHVRTAAVTEGVGDQVDDHALQEGAIRDDVRQVIRDPDGQHPPRLLRDRRVFDRHLAPDLRQRHASPLDGQLPLLDLRNLEEVLDHPHHLAAGALDLPQVADVGGRERVALPEREPDHHRDPVHRVLEIVDDHAREVVLEPLRLLLDAERLLRHLGRALQPGRDVALDEAAVDVGVDRERHVEEDHLDQRLDLREHRRALAALLDDRAQEEAQQEAEGADVPLRTEADALVRAADPEPALDVGRVDPSFHELLEVLALQALQLRDAAGLGAQQLLERRKAEQVGVEVGDDVVEVRLADRRERGEALLVASGDLEERAAFGDGFRVEREAVARVEARLPR